MVAELPSKEPQTEVYWYRKAQDSTINIGGYVDWRTPAEVI